MGTSILPVGTVWLLPPAQLRLSRLGWRMLPVLEALAHGGRLRSRGREAGGMPWKSGCQWAIPTTSPLPRTSWGSHPPPSRGHLQAESGFWCGVSGYRWEGSGERRRGAASVGGGPCAPVPCPAPAPRTQAAQLGGFTGGGCADSEEPGAAAAGQVGSAGLGAGLRGGGHAWGRGEQQG